MNNYLSFQRYRRTFVRPLRTARGEWALREGFIVRVECDSKVGYGEIAPIPEFGTETIETAETYLQGLAGSDEFQENVADLIGLPCCAFGLSVAKKSGRPAAKRDYAVAALLPAGRAALKHVNSKAEQGYTTFKWKIGIDSVAEEQAVFLKLLLQLPPKSKLRLDANGGLSGEALKSWLKLLQEYLPQVDYLEQPLPVGQEALMAEFAEFFQVPIALDESLNGSEGNLWMEAGAWPGPLVVKPALMGESGALVERLQPVAEQVVFSSVFETVIGLENALCLADQLPKLKRAIGFDTLDTFADDLMPLNSGPAIRAVDRHRQNFFDTWERLFQC